MSEMLPKSTGPAPDAGNATRAFTAPKGGWHGWPAWSGLLKSRVPLLVLCAWFFLYADRPFSLGFYSDDWAVLVESIQGTGPFSLTRLSHFVGTGQGYASRPVAGLIGFVISSIVGQNPFAYQLFGALLALCAALSLRAWLKSLLPQVSEAHPFAADLAAVIWLSLPWSVATTGWPVCAMAVLPAQIFFTEAARLMAAGSGREVKRLLFSAALLLASYLTYETFYFQGILLATFYWFRDRRGSGPWRHRLILTVCVVQAISIALNRLIAHNNPGMSKAFASGWQSLSWMSLRLLPNELLRSAGSLGMVWAALLGIMVLAAISSAVVLLLNSEGRRLSGGLGVIALSLSAIPVMCVIYALVGYRIAFAGFTSRTLTGISVAVAVLLYGLLSVILLSRRRVMAVTGTVAALLFVVVSGMAQQLHVSELAAVWREEKAVLAHVPVEQVRSLPQDSHIHILYIGPSYHGDISIFGAVWELTGAVFSLPGLREWQSPAHRSIHIHPATTLYNWSWDGSELIQESPGSWKSRFEGTALYIWKYDEGRIFQAEKGFRWNPAEAQNGSGTAPLSRGGLSGRAIAAASAAATLLKIDTHTQGNWEGVYGLDGFAIAVDSPRNPTYADVEFAGYSITVWDASTRDARALQKSTGVMATTWWTPLVRALGTWDRTASTWWSASSFTIDANLTDGNTHQVAIYCVDWDSGGVRAERIDVLDAATGAVLDTRTISDFIKGQYLVWNLRGHVRLLVTRTAGSNSVVSGLFFQ